MQTTTSETEKKEATSQTNNSTTNPSSSEQQEKSQLDEKSTQKTTETQTSFQKTIKFIPIPPARQKEYDRLKEYFGFDLGKFFGDIFNAMEDYNIDLINDLNHQLLSNYPQQTWIHKSMETVRKNMEQAIATSFDIFELYALQAIFHTPSIKYDHSKTTLPEELKELSEQEQTIHSEIQQLRDRILYEKQLNSKLSEENDRLKKEVKLWEKNKEKLEMISEVCKKEDGKFIHKKFIKYSQFIKRFDEYTC